MSGKISGKLIQGIGINNGEYPCNNGKNNTTEYEHWRGMLRRCQEIWWVKHPAYNETICSDNFKNYSFFYKWCNAQVGFGNKDENGKLWHLDKDLLLKGNKLYSEDVCVFIPREINNLIISQQSTRGEYPVGVGLDKRCGRYFAQCSGVKESSRHLGSFSTPEEAFEAYKAFKETYIKTKAEKYKDYIDHRVYQALMDYKIEITD